MEAVTARHVVCCVLTSLCIIQTSVLVIFTVRHMQRQTRVQHVYDRLVQRAWRVHDRCLVDQLNTSRPTRDEGDVSRDHVARTARADVYIERLITEQEAMLERHCSNETKLCLPGPKGDVGTTGHTGQQGAQGVVGAQGLTGNPGVIGNTGLKGNPGAQGHAGPKSTVGAQGHPGDKGDTGAPGVKGDTGVKGPAGHVGAKGQTGVKGDPGARGVQGDPGVKGAPGPNGDTGSKGATGPHGRAGAKGARYPTIRNCSCVAAPHANGSALHVVDAVPGSNLVLTCDITAIPTPDVKWSRDPQGLPQGATSVGNQLIIHDVKSSDVGKYTCTANNVMGSATVTFDIKISDLNCDFESGLCSWQQGTADNKDWTLNRGLTSTLGTGPAADHTKGNVGGQYVYLESSDGNRGDKADLQSPSLTLTLPLCLHFWYNMYGQGIDTLSVIAKDAAGNETVLWTRSHEQGQSWNEDKVTVFPPSGGGQMKVVFRATKSQSNEGDIALDDVKVTSGVCIEPPEASNCDFNANVCRWSNTGDWAWTTHAGPSGKPDTGPRGDRNNDTNQSYLYADGSSTQTAGSKARLVSPIIDTTDKECVEFYYNMHGNTEGSLKLNILGQDGTEFTLWQRSGDQTRDWQQARMTLPQSSLPINLVLEATRGSGSSSDVAVDDFRVLPNACGYNGLGCDFEELDLCTWTQEIRNDNFDWGVQVAGAGGQVGGPSVDHTYQTDQGHYVLVPNAGHPQGDKATLASRLLPRHTDYCLAMWVYIPSNTSGSLSVERENSGRVQEHIHTVGYQAPPAGQQPTWYFTNVTIPSFYTDTGIYLQATVVDSSAPPMAVDDITLTSGACA